jgi:hypothetical protein
MRVDSSRRYGLVQLQYCVCPACQERRKREVPVSEIWQKPRKK